MEASPGITLIVVTAGGGGGGGGAVTVSETVVFTPPALTLICVEPAERPVATPTFCPSELTPLTDATLVAELNQVKTTPVIALSNWSYPTAANCCVFPAWMEAVDGDAWIEVKTEGGRLTVRVIGLLWMP
jgi:hypothetical protein